MSMPAQIQWKLQVFCKWDTDAGKFVWYVISKHTSISLVSTPHHNAVQTEQNRPNHYINGHRHRNCCWVSLSQINESLDIPVSSWRMVHHIRPVLCVCQSWSTSGLEWFCTISKKASRNKEKWLETNSIRPRIPSNKSQFEDDSDSPILWLILLLWGPVMFMWILVLLPVAVAGIMTRYNITPYHIRTSALSGKLPVCLYCLHIRRHWWCGYFSRLFPI